MFKIKIISILLLLLPVFIYSQHDNKNKIFVDGLCGMCKDRIEKAANETAGIKEAFWNSSTKMLTYSYIPEYYDEMTLHRNIADAGHDTKMLKATDEVYENLHSCCKYRDSETPNEIENKADTENKHLHEADDHTSHNGNKRKVYGTVVEESENGTMPLVGVNLYWLDSNSGVVSDEEGKFSIDIPDDAHYLIVSYIGYENDTLHLHDEQHIQIKLKNSITIDEVEVIHKRKSTEISFLEPIKTYHIGEKELFKAACCNLSESFETNPTVDVNFTDAVTGTKQIEMLGLAGPYVQITRENMPNIRLLSSLYGLSFIPGTWIESMQLNKGTGSVVNGYESITGQINVELKKPENSEKFYVNLFTSNEGRFEANTNIRKKITDKISTALLLHGKYQQYKMDKNDDGFLDHPLSNQIIATNRWKYDDQKTGLQGQFGVNAVYIENLSGQFDYDFKKEQTEQSLWGAMVETERVDAWYKTGKVNTNKPWQSIGFQAAATYQNQNAFFGLRQFDAEQKSFYSNVIFQGRLSGESHLFKTGLSFQWDKLKENVLNTEFFRDEKVPGGFFEYSFNSGNSFSLVSGVRGDYHNNYGFFLTPRVHLKYSIFENLVYRASIGKGLRTATIFSENIGAFASSREIIIESESNENPYGLDAEIAWNFGTSISFKLHINERELVASADYYYTVFENQIIVDYDFNPQKVLIYNLDGISYSNSFQIQIDYEIFNGFDMRIAYRFNDVRTDYLSGKLQKPLSSKERAFINIAYETESNWKFDFTVNRQGTKRIPSTKMNPEEYQTMEWTPVYYLTNCQITKSWKRKFEVYAGVENLFNFKQDNPIIASSDPFGDFFDASMVWGPISGRKSYLGVRYRIND